MYPYYLVAASHEEVHCYVHAVLGSVNAGVSRLTTAGIKDGGVMYTCT